MLCARLVGACRRGRRGGRLGRCADFALIHSRDSDGKGRADPFFAFQLKRAAQQFGIFARDGQAQTRAAEFPRRGPIGLLKRLEHGLLFGGRNADAGIRDRDSDQIVSIRGRRHQQRDRALFGEFKGIGQEVADDLGEFIAIRVQRRVPGIANNELQFFFFRNRVKQIAERV